ncbi:MAG: hypothetical protein ACKVJG_12515 [Candidatus Latescibacterota bacterium]|jgi:hypothetical protein|tara:strand:- start:1026 stop:1256 length:231 start_codon:yes stop_codon:yes gene_type:complete
MSQSSELTTRDVLQQVDRRLELIEGDVRSLNSKVDDRFSAQDVKFENRFRWTIGLLLMSWMSTMGAILFRLGPIAQ